MFCIKNKSCINVNRVRRKRPPVTLLPQITNRQNGEFEAAHSRKKGYRKLNRLQYPFNYA